MAYRWRPKSAEVDPEDPRAWGECDRCGMLWPLYKLTWQWAYRGPSPQNTQVLVCPKHLDPLNILDATIILPPDPEPVMNERPPTYAIDEAGPTQQLATQMRSAESEIGASFYIDLFDGDPAHGGASVLEALTGSATRSNIAASMATAGLIATNSAEIEVVAIARASAVVTHAAAFDAATDGDMLASGALFLPQTVTLYNGAAFAAGAITVLLTAEGLAGQWDFSDARQSGQILTAGL